MTGRGERRGDRERGGEVCDRGERRGGVIGKREEEV